MEKISILITSIWILSVLANYLIQSKFSNERRKNQNRSITTTNHNTGSDTGNLTDARENASWFSCHIWLFEMVLRIFSGQPQSVVSKTKAIQDHFWYSTENCSTKKINDFIGFTFLLFVIVLKIL